MTPDETPRKAAVYEFGRFRLDKTRRMLTCDGAPVTLTARLFEMLLLFVENPERVVDKDEIMATIWPGRFVQDGSISQAVFALRKAMSGAGEDDRFIETVAGHGYRFTAQVQTISDAYADVPTAPTAIAQRVGTESFRAWAMVAGIGVIVIVAAAGAYIASQRVTVSAAGRNTVVLADFQNMTGDPALSTVLGKVLEIDIAQSPYLSILPPQRVRDTLALMERPKDAKLTPELAQEVCARNGGKAVLSGGVAMAGSRYIVTLQANTCVSGDSVVQSKAEASRKEDVPDALDGLSARVRGALNESIASIREFDVPIAQATTSSFEALTDYSLGEKLRVSGDASASLPLFRRAIELDPTFALAYEELGAGYSSLREGDIARTYYLKAFALENRASENERLRISANYYQRAGDFLEAARIYQLWTQTYPRDSQPWSRLANLYTSMARYSDAIAAGKEALRLDPENNAPYVVLARAYKRATRFAEAKAICARAIAKGYDNWDIHGLLYEIAFAQSDEKTMAEEVAKEKGKPTESWMLDYEALAAATAGKLRQSHELFDGALQSAHAQGADTREEIIAFYADDLDATAVLGTREDTQKLAHSVDFQDQTEFGLAEAGDYADASAQAAQDARQHAGESQTTVLYLPLVEAEIALGENKPADAIAALAPERPYRMRDFWGSSLAGNAWLALHEPQKAEAEFRDVLANRGVDANSQLYPMAYLGLARALAMEGKIAESRVQYETLFAFWKDADADLPALLDAKREYAKLSAASTKRAAN